MSSSSHPSTPRLQEAYQQLMEAIQELGFKVEFVPWLPDMVAEVNMEQRSIRVAANDDADAELVIMALAHEARHVCDPYYQRNWYKYTGNYEWLHSADREVVAQTVAKEFCLLYGIDVAAFSDSYIAEQHTYLNRPNRLRADVALCSLLPRTTQNNRLLAQAKSRWRWRAWPFIKRRPRPRSTPLPLL